MGKEAAKRPRRVHFRGQSICMGEDEANAPTELTRLQFFQLCSSSPLNLNTALLRCMTVTVESDKALLLALVVSALSSTAGKHNALKHPED